MYKNTHIFKTQLCTTYTLNERKRSRRWDTRTHALAYIRSRNVILYICYDSWRTEREPRISLWWFDRYLKSVSTWYKRAPATRRHVRWLQSHGSIEKYTRQSFEQNAFILLSASRKRACVRIIPSRLRDTSPRRCRDRVFERVYLKYNQY